MQVIAVEFEHVSKTFNLQSRESRSFQELLINLWSRRSSPPPEKFWGLKDVNFRVERGETFALIGANGSGKSTVLKLIARTMEPTSGRVNINGRVAALLELGAGFHLDLSGRENIYLNGSILGLKHAQVKRQFDHIVSFAELERFIDTPVRNYSSGMLMRLGFSVATAFQPDILLIDEVLAVGDATFQSRCMQRIAEIQEQGATIILVSHDLGTVQQLCRRALWLHRGQGCAEGPVDEVASKYLEDVWTSEQARADEACADGAEPCEDGRAPHEARWGSGEVLIEKVEFLETEDRTERVYHTGERFGVRMWYRAARPVECPAFGVSFYDQRGDRINGPNTVWGNAGIARISGHGYVDYVVDSLPLLPGNYELTVAVYDRQVARPYDHWHRMASFVVIPGNLERQDGQVFIPCRWEHRPQVQPESQQAIPDALAVPGRWRGDTRG